MRRTRDQDDGVEFVTEEDYTSIASIKNKILRNWRYNVPIILCTMLGVLVVSAVVGLAITVNNLKSELKTLREQMNPTSSSAQQLVQETSKNPQLPGTTYIRWGRTKCDGDADLLYEGFSAGASSHSQSLPGGGVNYQCMTTDPEWNKFDLSNDTLAFSWMYGAEYLSFNLGIFPDDAHGRNVPCSVCYAPRSAKVMIPGKRTCPQGWTREYEGYLMSSMVTENRNTFECVDQNPEYLDGMQNVTGGALFYFSSAYCQGAGSFGPNHCPPYYHAREITCVVCTK